MKQLQVIGFAVAAAVIAYALWAHGAVTVWAFLLVALFAVVVTARVASASNVITPARVALALAVCTAATWRFGSWPYFLGIAAMTVFAWYQYIFKDPHLVLKKVFHWGMPASASERSSVGMFRRNNRKQGVAGFLDVALRASVLRVKQKAKAVRPSLARMTFWQRLRVPVAAVAVRLARVGVQSVYAALEDFLVVCGGPRSGKTGLICLIAAFFPGALLFASTRVEIIGHTAGYRKAPWKPPRRWWHRWFPPTVVDDGQERPIEIFNPSGDGPAELQSTIVFPPLDGCEDPQVAIKRGEDMVLPLRSHDSSANNWVDKGGEALGLLLHAAALGAKGKPRTDMYSVQKWAANISGHRETLEGILERSPERSMQTAVEAFGRLNKDTQTSITNGLLRALRWISHPAAKRAAGVDVPPHLRPAPLDIADFVKRRGTLYLIGEDDKVTAPLVSALTAHVGRWAKSTANSLPRNRHDPAIGMLLDEVANGFPVPLDKWSSWFGGSGIWMCAVIQSLAQLRNTWTDDAKRVIVNNAWALMYLGGNKDPDDLEQFSKLAGMREEVTITTREGKVVSESTRPVPVISVAQLTRLAARKTIMFITGVAPAIGRTRMLWKLRDYDRMACFDDYSSVITRPERPPLTVVPQVTERDQQARVVA